MILFEGNPGKVVRLRNPALQCQTRCMNISRADPAVIDYDLYRSFVTRMVVSCRVNVQFMHTLGDNIYVYVFGDRLGQVMLSGLSVGCPCSPTGVDRNVVSGAEGMYGWYMDNRPVRRTTPMRFLIGTTPVEGIMTGLTLDLIDTASSLVQWQAEIALLTEERNELLPMPEEDAFVPGGGDLPGMTLTAPGVAA